MTLDHGACFVQVFNGHWELGEILLVFGDINLLSYDQIAQVLQDIMLMLPESFQPTVPQQEIVVRFLEERTVFWITFLFLNERLS